MYRDLVGVICSDEDDDDANYSNAVSAHNQNVITTDQLKKLQGMVDENWTFKIFDYYKIDDLAQLKQSDFNHVIKVVTDGVKKK